MNASVPFGTQVILPVRPRSLAAHPRMRVDLAKHKGLSGDVVRLMALGGAGIARLARFHVAADLAAGRLVPVLEAFNPGDAEDVHVLYVGHARLALRIRSFVDFLAAHATVEE